MYAKHKRRLFHLLIECVCYVRFRSFLLALNGIASHRLQYFNAICQNDDHASSTLAFHNDTLAGKWTSKSDRRKCEFIQSCCKRLANIQHTKINNKRKMLAIYPNNCLNVWTTKKKSQMRLRIERRKKNHHPKCRGRKKALKCLSTDRNTISC